MSETKVVEKIKTHILCSVIFFFENSTVYEIMWKNIVPRAGHEHCMLDTEAYNTHSPYVMLTALQLQQWLHEHASILS